MILASFLKKLGSKLEGVFPELQLHVTLLFFQVRDNAFGVVYASGRVWQIQHLGDGQGTCGLHEPVPDILLVSMGKGSSFLNEARQMSRCEIVLGSLVGKDCRDQVRWGILVRLLGSAKELVYVVKILLCWA
jgi:hypothetical protein